MGDDWTFRRYQPEDVWAFQPIKKPAPPSSDLKPIDSFVHAKLAEAKHTPAPRADFRTLIRRATYDLTGLPPTLEELDSPRSYEEHVQQLLDSPRFGEHVALYSRENNARVLTLETNNDVEYTDA